MRRILFSPARFLNATRCRTMRNCNPRLPYNAAMSPLASINLRQLLLIRTVIIITLALALCYAYWRDASLYIVHLAVILGIWAVINLFSWWHNQCGHSANHRVTRAQFFAQLSLDIVIFAAFLYFAGGAGNPFVSYFLVPICISATTLGLRHTMALTGLALLAYTQLLFFYLPLELLSPNSGHANHANHGQHAASNELNLHVLGMWFNFLVSAIIITIFGVRLSRQLREADDQLANAREHQLQNEQLLAIAAVTSGAAHELGTPLNTMTLLAGDMQADDPKEQRQADIELMREQLAHCKKSLQELVETARQHSSGERQSQDIGGFINQLKSRWLIIRPDTALTVNGISGITIFSDPTLSQTLLNLLNNAADNSPEQIQLCCTEEQNHLVFSVIDFGAPIPEEQQASLGEAFNTNKEEAGLGLGLFLSHATARRLNGSLQYISGTGDQGNKMLLRIPKASLQ